MIHFLLIPFFYSIQCSDENWLQKKCEPSCIFQQGTLDSNNLNLFPKNCSSICADLVIDADSNLTENELIPTFKNVKIIFGTIIISRTNLTSLKFLAGLESLECDDIASDPDLNNPKNGLKLYKNFEMTEIGMINWTNTSCSVQIEMYANFSNFNVPNLKNFNSSDPSKHEIYIQYDYFGIISQNYVCFSLEETSNFYGAENVVMSYQNQKYCDHLSSTVFGEKLCKIPENENIKNLEENCQRIFGILKIGPGDENFVYKLKNVTWIYGKLIIENTTLTSIDFLNNLEFVISFNEQCETSSLQFSHNKNLMEIRLPNLKRIFGILKIGPGDEKFVYKLKNVTWIYGQLIVENTNLTSINFLNNLGFVISFDNYWKRSSLQILQNKNLMEIKLPNLKKVLGGYNPFVITGNNGNFANFSKICSEIRHVLYKAPSNVPYVDRQTCEAIQKKNMERVQILEILKVFRNR
ncbi:Protein CBG06509 [Caenorhabditis briggsae]|uniref:Protein CBG06506 n=1 Tax=Caenorhabditis briggsae TaxID=6238 RepID=G2J6K7_CAEBR|nr:Protein CBG06506 [Caenorhabditis briggsae]XP_045093233.1 Protein CBG06509 [Caenorhabditis briggsae]CAP26800.2 Protein CBG06506 [Caenorhabditis briggsae]CAP26803.2 Protein CBG06509 [Caenorhabditis briggsae]